MDWALGPPAIRQIFGTLNYTSSICDISSLVVYLEDLTAIAATKDAWAQHTLKMAQIVTLSQFLHYPALLANPGALLPLFDIVHSLLLTLYS